MRELLGSCMLTSSVSTSGWRLPGISHMKSHGCQTDILVCILMYTVSTPPTAGQVGRDPGGCRLRQRLTHLLLETLSSLCAIYTSPSSSTSVFIPTGYIYIHSHIYIFKSGEERKSVICAHLFIGRFTSFKEQEDPSSFSLQGSRTQDTHSHAHTHTHIHGHEGQGPHQQPRRSPRLRDYNRP